MPDRKPLEHRTRKANLRLAVLLLMLPGFMIAAAFASVPFYRIFCQVTGYNGTTQRADAPSTRVLDRAITIRFDANVSSDLAWSFRPVQGPVHIKIGENTLVFFEARNLTDTPLTGTASFNVTPEDAGAYFDKIQCFCFTEQTLEPHQTVQMPVSFFIDPAIMDDPNARRIEEIVLSYTFFKVDKPAAAKAEGAASKPFETAGSPDKQRRTRPSGTRGIIPWRTHTQSIMTTTSSIRVRGRSSARRRDSSWPSAPSSG
jgi:cytochrome c oxidase assembly protein subunit 11